MESSWSYSSSMYSHLRNVWSCWKSNVRRNSALSRTPPAQAATILTPVGGICWRKDDDSLRALGRRCKAKMFSSRFHRWSRTQEKVWTPSEEKYSTDLVTSILSKDSMH